MIGRVFDMNGSNDGFHAFIDASKRASQRGDLRQAERLLKTSLKNVEQQMFMTECALKETVESLLELYRGQQGRDDEIRVLERKLLNMKPYTQTFEESAPNEAKKRRDREQ